MKKHTRIYLQYFDYGEQDMIPCEICGLRAVDIHHIIYRSHEGDDDIKNLMALCRHHHDQAHNGKLSTEYLKKLHEQFIKNKI